MFCRSCSTCRCIFNVFVGKKLISTSYSSTILKVSPPIISRGFLLFLFYFFFNIYFWLCWVFVSVLGLSLVAASGGHSSSRCTGLSLSQLLLLRSTGSRCAGSAVVAHGPSCSVACGILPDQGSNLCPLHWQADSQPLCHQGSPRGFLLKIQFHCSCIYTTNFSS